MDRMSQTCDNYMYDLTICTTKTEVHVVHQPAHGKPYSDKPSLLMDKNCKLSINSPIREALFPEQCASMIRLLPELERPVWHLADFAQIIMQTCPCNECPLTPHFYKVKLGFTGLYLIFIFLL